MPRRLIVFFFVASCGGGTAQQPTPQTPEKQAPNAIAGEAPSTTETSDAPPSDETSDDAPTVAPTPLETKKPTIAPTPTPTPTNAPAPSPTSGGASTASPSPESVCTHVVKLVAAEFGSAGASMPSDQKKQMHDDCVKESKKEQASDPKGYACDAACILAATEFAGIQACKGKC